MFNQHSRVRQAFLGRNATPQFVFSQPPDSSPIHRWRETNPAFTYVQSTP
jgi:hypothetical protein